MARLGTFLVGSAAFAGDSIVTGTVAASGHAGATLGAKVRTAGGVQGLGAASGCMLGHAKIGAGVCGGGTAQATLRAGRLISAGLLHGGALAFERVRPCARMRGSLAASGRAGERLAALLLYMGEGIRVDCAAQPAYQPVPVQMTYEADGIPQVAVPLENLADIPQINFRRVF